jgi:hypothetical protein
MQLRNSHVKTYYLGAKEYLEGKGVEFDPNDHHDITNKLERSSFYFPRFRKWILSDSNDQGWSRDNKHKVFSTTIQDNRSEKKRNEKLSLTLAFHYSSLDTRELKSVERFLREHPENRVMIVKITEEK